MVSSTPDDGSADAPHAPPTAPAADPAAIRLGPLAAGRCRRRIHLDHDPTADRSRWIPPDAGLQLRLDDLAQHRRAVRERLSAVLEITDRWDPMLPDRPAAIWAPRLLTPTRFATPDLLLRDGDGRYLPVLVRAHRTTDPGSGGLCSQVLEPLAVAPSPTLRLRTHPADALALAHVYRLLQELGLASRHARGGIIGRGGPAADAGWDDATMIVWYELAAAPSGDAAPSRSPGHRNGARPGPAMSTLADYDARFTDRTAVARAAATGQPALARPSRIAECRRCPWWPVCGPELEAAHDISLLVAGSDVDVLHGAGIVTYDDLAAMDQRLAAALPLTGIPPADAHSRALAMVAGVPMVRRTARIDPRRADVELDVDMESYSDDGAYLWGTYLTAAGSALPAGYVPGYRPFVTWAPLESDAAGENFVAFWRYLTDLRAACAGAGLTFAAYCYSRKAEERWMYGTPQRFPRVDGMPARADIDRFCSSPQWVDVYAEVKRCFVVPGSLRLKKVAAVAGFSWRDPEPSGENSMAWYRVATATSRGDDAPGTLAPEAAAHRERILRYNEDDVLATLALRRWMTDRADEMPTVADLEARAAARGA